ncbi:MULTISPECIES: baeRF12 domain-containing protein [unclassified Sphingomonas]|uniref:baeRF12 domain-containing protein n=1 Tax=unclassified Sphingomonas TaxID=196159 RepID=UPI0006F3B75C|nr:MULTISPECIES: host attachment family protein [unclassified Sphingomonas]KQX20051.1 hypothetical protein ASD17_09105 [Sphingomonas sp. Root1294]KQY67301.1 hypothetical protein ASD39_09165 [Sphingomonas sp. Root50]KRB90676.1 hypothetical protein ASE22_10175 [Sphingomonas sp. Root720]
MLLPHGTLILVVDGSRMRLLRNGGNDVSVELEVLEESALDNPASHVLGSAAPGRAFESSGSARHSYSASDLHQRREDRFGQEAMKLLCRKALDGVPIVMIAPPHMLATLRAARDHRLQLQVLAEIDKDMTHCSPTEISSFLRKRT